MQKEPLIIGYTRDTKGRVVNRHTKRCANTLHTGGGTTAQYLYEPQILKSERTEEEKRRRHLYDDKDAKFQAKLLKPRNDGMSNMMYNAQNPLRVCTAFSGYDSQCMALDMLKREYPSFDYKLVAWSEIDKFAIRAHNAVYPQYADRNYGDISKIDWAKVPDFDLFTYSFPCTDISAAGMQKGLAEGSGTRSGLLWECRKAIEAKRPKYLLMENVKALTQKKFMPDFLRWQHEMEAFGYTNFWQVLNAKDYGIPQNRERVFMVSILDKDAQFHFPKKMPLKLRLADMLEPHVDEKYYLNDEKVQILLDQMQDNIQE